MQLHSARNKIKTMYAVDIAWLIGPDILLLTSVHSAVQFGLEMV